jgi:cytochrome P450
VAARQPNHHLGFGCGVYFCLGARLARREARILLAEVAKRFPTCPPKVRQVDWLDSMTLQVPAQMQAGTSGAT